MIIPICQLKDWLQKCAQLRLKKNHKYRASGCQQKSLFKNIPRYRSWRYRFFLQKMYTSTHQFYIQSDVFQNFQMCRATPTEAFPLEYSKKSNKFSYVYCLYINWYKFQSSSSLHKVQIVKYTKFHYSFIITHK